MRLVLAFALLSVPAYAQQSLFNVPSTQVTEKGGLFGQVQIGATPEGGDASATLDVGVFSWLELGLNLMHLPLAPAGELPETAPSTSVTAMNANLAVRLTDFMVIGGGAMGGVGFNYAAVFEPLILGWATARFEAPGRWGAYVVGAYSGTRSALGKGPPVGGMFGFEIPLLPMQFHLQADWFIGLNDLSVAVVGGTLFLTKELQLSLGAQLPSPGSGNPFGGVLSFTYSPVAADP